MSRSDRRISRRAMLTRSAQAATIITVSNHLQPLFAMTEDRQPKSRGFKIGACDWSLGRSCDTAAFDVAKEIGLDGVQISMGTLANDMQLRRPSIQKAYLAAAKRTGMEIGSLAIGQMNSVPLKSDPRAAQWLLDSVDICKAMGLSISMPAMFGAGDIDMTNTAEVDHLVKVVKAAARRAEDAGVMIALENYLSAEDNMTIIDRVGSPAVGVYYDVGNSTDKGRDVYKEIRTLGKLVLEVHAKDGPHILGQGRVDFEKVRLALDDIEYRGWIVLESAKPDGVVPSYTAQCKFLRRIFPRDV